MQTVCPTLCLLMITVQQVLAAEPHNVKALLRRANAREAQGNKTGAAADYAAAVAVEPRNTDAAAGLQRLAPPPPPPHEGAVPEAAMADA